MSAPVLSLGPVVAKIEATALYRSVGGAADMRRAAQQGAIGSPIAFVMPGREDPRPSGLAGGVQHMSVSARFVIVTLAEDLRRDAGGRAMSQLETVRAGLLAALAGWGPDYADGPVTHLSGQLVTGPLPGVLLGWQDEFSLRFRRSLTSGG